MKRHQALHKWTEDPDSFSGIRPRCRATKKHLRAPLSTLEHLLRVSVNAIVELERVALGAGWGGKPLDCEAPRRRRGSQLRLLYQ